MKKDISYLFDFGVWLVKNIFFAAIVFAGVLCWYRCVDAFVNSIPEVIMTGLNVCGQLLPAVGLALLMKMIWTKEIAVYYLLGFILYIYIGLPIVAIAVLGIIIVVITALREFEINKLSKMRTVSAADEDADNELEDFLQ